MRLFDAHCHLQWPKYQDDLPEVLARMQEADMGAVVIGTDLEKSKEALALAQSHDFLWAAVGLHPNDNLDETFDAESYEALAREPKVVAIGECGLDYYRSERAKREPSSLLRAEGSSLSADSDFRTDETEENKSKQKARFLAHIALAQKVEKPLIIHCRNAHEDMLSILGEARLKVPVVIHFCTVSGDIAKRYLELGCYLSFPGPVTYTDMYDDSIRACPMDRLLIETDAPFAAPVPYRRQRNEPSYVIEVARKVAAVKGVSLDDIAAQTMRNASSIFSI